MLNLNLKPKANFIKNKSSSPQRHMKDDSLFNNDKRNITKDVGFFLIVLIFIYFCDFFKGFCFSFILNLVHRVFVYVIYVVKHNFS